MDARQQKRRVEVPRQSRDGGWYAGNRIVVADRGRMAAIDIGGIVAAVAVGGSDGGFGDMDTPVLA